MKDPGQRAFIGRLRAALGRRTGSLESDGPAHPAAPAGRRDPVDPERLMARLAQAAEPLHLTVAACPDPSVAAASIRGLVAERSPEWGGRKQVVAWDHPLVHALDLPGALSGQNVPVAFVEPLGAAPDAARLAAIRKQVVDSFVGVTSADFCLADTATLVMKTRPGQPRSVSLVPSIHVAVIEVKQLLWDLGELYQRLATDPVHRSEGLTNCMTFISGPSKTADIEMTLVHGAHGPRELFLFVVFGDRA